MSELIQNNQKLSMDARVLSYQTDRNSLLKPSYALRLMQEAAAEHSDKCGYGTRMLYNKKMMFILIAVSINFDKMPFLNDDIFVETWSCRQNGLMFTRPGRIADKNRNTICCYSSKWVVVSTETRRILKPSETGGFAAVFCDEQFDLRDKKIPLPKDMSIVGEREIRYSDIDYNNHANNCAYADFVLDFIPCDMAEMRVDKLDIYFHSEALLGDKLKIFCKECDGKFYFKGEHERGVCFDAMVSLKKIEKNS